MHFFNDEIFEEAVSTCKQKGDTFEYSIHFKDYNMLYSNRSVNIPIRSYIIMSKLTHLRDLIACQTLCNLL